MKLLILAALLVSCVVAESPLKLSPYYWKSVEPVKLANGVSAYSGVSFSTWAPHADEVFILGSWSSEAFKMTSDGTGYWTYTDSDATIGDTYNYIIHYNSQNYTRLDPTAREVTYDSSGNWKSSKIHDPDFDWGSISYELPAQTKIVIYELHIPSFNPSSTVGTFDDAIEKLDYLAYLGVNVVQLMPTIEFATGPRGWGYDPGLPYVIMTAFGGYSGLKTFVKAAHDRGLGVFLDVVWNHMGTPNMLNQYDGWSQSQSGLPSGSTPEGIYYYQNSDASTLWGPRPNYASSDVRNYITGNIEMLITECHIDGYRIDSVICIRKGAQYCWQQADDLDDGIEVLREMNSAAKNLGAFSIAEDLQNNATVSTAISSGGIGFDAQWDDTSYYQLHELISNGDDSARNMQELSQLISADYPNSGGSWRVIYTENHDKCSGQGSTSSFVQGRWPNVVDSSNPTSYYPQKLSMLALGVVLTVPGVPMLFYGQEFLMHSNFVFGDVPNLDWSMVGEYTASGGWSSTGPFKGLFDLTRTLIRLRLNSDSVSEGLTQGSNVNVLYASTSDKVMVFQRGNVIVVLNLSVKSYPIYSIGLPNSGTWHVRLNSDLQVYSSLFGNVGSGISSITASSPGLWNLGYSGPVALGAYSIVILSQ